MSKFRKGERGVWKYKTDNNMRGMFGETDLDKKVIRINKKIHKKAKKKAIYGIPKKHSTVINTIIHELKHKKSPRMHEKNVRKYANKKAKTMGRKQKKRLYAKFK